MGCCSRRRTFSNNQRALGCALDDALGREGALGRAAVHVGVGGLLAQGEGEVQGEAQREVRARLSARSGRGEGEGEARASAL